MTRRFQNLGIAKIGLTSISIAKKSSKHRVFLSEFLFLIRVAELGNLSSGAKMAMKIFVKRVFTIFVSNASFLRVIANLQN